MIARSRSLLLFVAVLIAACNEPTGVSNSPPNELALARGGGGITGVLLPTLGGASAVAHAVNDAGLAVGYSSDPTGTMFAVRWGRTNGGWSIKVIGGPGSRAVAINTNGTAVGYLAGAGKLWPAIGGEIELGPGKPRGINAAETVVGVRESTPPSEAAERAVAWRQPSSGWDAFAVNASQDLPAFPGGTGELSANAINDAGVIAGVAGVSEGISKISAVRWHQFGDQWGAPVSVPGAENYLASVGRAINDNGDIAGHARDCLATCSAYGIFWPSGSSGTSLEPFFGGSSSVVRGLNNERQAVGSFFDIRRGNRAFIWRSGQTSIQQLGGPGGYSAAEAYDINNSSPALAVGYGYGANKSRAIVWTIPIT